MSNAKHTPGPWRTGGKDGRIIYAADGFAVADATVFHGRHEGEHSENARLIAAAPELLEACETFHEWMCREEAGFVKAGNSRETPEGEAAWRAWYEENLRLCSLSQEQSRAAIAKARGE